MSFTRSHRNDRRRRVIRETIASDSDFAVESARAQRRARRNSVEETSEILSTGYRDPGYSQAVRKTCQQRFVQLIPIRKGALALALTVMWSIWALLLLSHYLFHVRPHASGRSPILFLQLFDLRSPHSIANWMTCQLWTLTAIVAWTIYRIRKHKLDDYRAKYRVWILLTVVALFSSFDASTSCLFLLGQSIDGWTRREIGYGGWPLILASYASLVAILGIRLSGELRPTPSAIASWFSGLFAWACAALLGTGLLKTGWSQGTIDLVVGGCWLGGVLAVFQAAGMFLRHCYIHAQKRFVERSVMTPTASGFQMPKMPQMPKLPRMPWSKRDPELDDEEDKEFESEDRNSKSSRSSNDQRSIAAAPEEPKRPMRLFGFIPSRQECNEQLADEPIREELPEVDTGLTKKPGWFGLGGNKNAAPAAPSSPSPQKQSTEIRSTPKPEPKPQSKNEQIAAPKSTSSSAQSEQSTEAKRRWIPSFGRSKPQGAGIPTSGGNGTSSNTKTVASSESTKANSSNAPTGKAADAGKAAEPGKEKSSWFAFGKSKGNEKSQDKKPVDKKQAAETIKQVKDKPAARKLASRLTGWLDGLKLKPPVDATPAAQSSGQNTAPQSQAPKPISNSSVPFPSTQSQSAEDDDDNQVDYRNLSKAERKRLRRQQGTDRNAA